MGDMGDTAGERGLPGVGVRGRLYWFGECKEGKRKEEITKIKGDIPFVSFFFRIATGVAGSITNIRVITISQRISSFSWISCVVSYI